MQSIKRPDDAPKDRALPFFTNADFERMAAVVEELPRFRSDSTNRATAAIFAGMDHHVRMERTDWISYSRRNAYYTDKAQYYGNDFTAHNIKTSIDALHDLGWMEGWDKATPHIGGSGTQSRFMPNREKFSTLRLPRLRKPRGELIRLRDRDTKELIGFRETERVQRDRKWVERINEHLEHAPVEFLGGLRRNGDICYFEEHAVDLSQKTVYRVYAGNFSLGGRFYGTWWQGVTDEDRLEFIRIDGKRVAEEDYANQHPSFLYYLVGQPLIGDAYDIGPKYEHMRKPCKRALNIMINASSESQAVGALAQHVEGDYRVARDIIRLMKIRHAAIARYFFSDMGIRMQFIDSQMCKAIMDKLAIKQGVTVLPIHDSFMVAEDNRQALLETMEEVFETTAKPVLDSIRDSKASSSRVPHTPLACRVGHGLGVSGGSAASDSESGQKGKRSKNPKTNPSIRRTSKTRKTKIVEGEKTVRWKRRPQNLTTDDQSNTDTNIPLVATQEKRSEKAVEDMQTTSVDVETGRADQCAVRPSPDGSRHEGSPFVDLLVQTLKEDEVERKIGFKRWSPTKTTTADLIRDEARRRDDMRNGKWRK